MIKRTLKTIKKNITNIPMQNIIIKNINKNIILKLAPINIKLILIIKLIILLLLLILIYINIV